MPTHSGTPGNDFFVGSAEDDTFIGRGGNDRFEGRNGNDIYYVDDNNDIVIETVHHGYDSIYTTGSYVLSASTHVEVLSAHRHDGTAAVNLKGNGLDNLLMGNGGPNILNGGGGAGDRLAGFGGDDIYYVDYATVQVFEEEPDGTYARGGRDTLYTSVSYILSATASIEVLSAAGHANTTSVNLTGNGFDNEIWGNAGANVLDGGGGAGDRLIGLGGDDSYRVSAASTRVFEAAGGGYDTVFASVSYTLSDSHEIEGLATDNDAGTAAINLTGNGLANAIRGNAGANLLDGRGGDDVMTGLGGNDTYYVDSAGDQVIETEAGGSRDVLYASVSYTLAGSSHVEILSARGHAFTTAIDLTGNSIRNEIVGNNGINLLSGAGGDDILHGLGGDDTLLGGTGNDVLYGSAGDDILDGGDQTTSFAGDSAAGGSGNDTYFVDSPHDLVSELAGEGFDTVLVTGSNFSNRYALPSGAEIEILAINDPNSTRNLRLDGNEFANEIRGNRGLNVLSGGAGDDVLDGLGDNDSLTGGTGADTFRFTTALVSNVDAIQDFAVGIDKIALDDAIFAGLAPGPLPASAFSTGTSAQEGDDRIIYNSATGQLFFDADGVGGAPQTQFANVGPGLVLTAGDFIVI